MISQPDLTKQIKLISQTAWTIGSHTSVNDMIEYIVRETVFVVLNSVEEEFNLLKETLEELKEKLEDASEEGRVPQSQRYSEAPNKRVKVTKTSLNA